MPGITGGRYKQVCTCASDIDIDAVPTVGMQLSVKTVMGITGVHVLLEVLKPTSSSHLPAWSLQ
jgi:hypothetical protein